MRGPIISVRNLSKRYRLGEIGAGSLREELHRLWSRLHPHPRLSPSNSHLPSPVSCPEAAKAPGAYAPRELWALRDISFDVAPGEVLGIIGRNGAGKSTLLKILSRITEPTSGEALLRGRVASLLEVGTGFHPELTGRENVYLSGAILGMRRAEIARKFDEIVAFAGVESFIDTPVKRYSSGMQVRLGFAVAAHLDPEILIVDEVLAVGDTDFQRRCMEKMADVTSAVGRTILFVSHNLSAVKSLCKRSIEIKEGRVIRAGPTDEVLAHYLETGATYRFQRDPALIAARASRATIVSAEVIAPAPRQGRVHFSPGEQCAMCVRVSIPRGQRVELIVSFLDQLRRPLWTSINSDGQHMVEGTGVPCDVLVRCTIPPLTVSRLAVDMALAETPEHWFLDHIIDALAFDLHQAHPSPSRIRDASYPLKVECRTTVQRIG